MKTKAFSIIYFLVFAAFAYLQLNDPDPIMWVAIYTIVAVSSLSRLFVNVPKKLYLGITLALVAISLFYIPGFIEYLGQPDKKEIVGEMVYKKPYIEETREFIGLWMAAGGMFHHYKL